MIAQAKKHIEYLVNKTKYLTFVFCDLSKFRLFFRLFFMHCFTLLQIMELLPEEDPNYLNSIQRLQNKYLKNLNIYIFEISNYPPNIEQLFCLEAIVYHYNEYNDKSNYIVAIKLFNNYQMNVS